MTQVDKASEMRIPIALQSSQPNLNKEKKMTRQDKEKCCLCGKDFKDKYDRNNAEPLKSGDCCGICNDDKVIPARLASLLS